LGKRKKKGGKPFPSTTEKEINRAFFEGRRKGYIWA